jgi:hypothetical protein
VLRAVSMDCLNRGRRAVSKDAIGFDARELARAAPAIFASLHGAIRRLTSRRVEIRKSAGEFHLVRNASRRFMQQGAWMRAGSAAFLCVAGICFAAFLLGRGDPCV